MKAIRLYPIFLLLIIALSGTGISSAQDRDVARENTLIITRDQALPILNFTGFQVPGANRSYGIEQLLYEPLFILNHETSEMMPWLGLSMEANETLDVWTLVLREGVKWQDGEAFNADDVVFTINFYKDFPTDTFGTLGIASSTGLDEWVESVEKIDDLTVQFNLKKPNPRFQLDHFAVRITSSITMLPEHIFSQFADDPEAAQAFTFYDPEKGWPVGTGPYKFLEATETAWVWERDDNYWGVEAGFQDLPAPQHIEFVFTPAADIQVAMALQGATDVLFPVTFDSFQALQIGNPDFIAWYNELPYAWLDACPRSLLVNTTVEPWNSPEMRHALNLLINRTQLVDLVFRGTGRVTRTFYPEYPAMQPIIGMLEEAGLTVPPLGDVSAAQSIIEAAGYTLGDDGLYQKDGEILSFDLLALEGGSLEEPPKMIATQLRRGGIDATATVTDWPTWSGSLSRGQFEGIVAWLPCGSVNEPWVTLDWLNERGVVPIGETSTSNAVRWANSEFTAIIDELGSLALDDPRVMELTREAHTIFYSELPAIPLYQSAFILPFNTTYWTNWPTADNPYIQPPYWWGSFHVVIHNIKSTR
jgi:peptide/nickel transport system substrate-binding protein